MEFDYEFIKFTDEQHTLFLHIVELIKNNENHTSNKNKCYVAATVLYNYSALSEQKKKDIKIDSNIIKEITRLFKTKDVYIHTSNSGNSIDKHFSLKLEIEHSANKLSMTYVTDTENIFMGVIWKTVF